MHFHFDTARINCPVEISVYDSLCYLYLLRVTCYATLNTVEYKIAFAS